MEKTLIFKYPGEYQDKIAELSELLEAKGIQFKVYNNGNDWPTDFKVWRSGYRWNDIYKIINSVKAARYRFE